MAFIRKPSENTFLNYNCCIDSTSIAKVNLTKVLGVTFDSKLKFESNVNTMVKKAQAQKTLGFLFRSFRKSNRVETYKPFYFIYIRIRKNTIQTLEDARIITDELILYKINNGFHFWSVVTQLCATLRFNTQLRTTRCNNSIF